MDARTVSVRDGTFRVEVHQAGAGEPLLWLHGSGGLERGPYLDRLAERFTLFAPVHPGFGESEGLEHLDDVTDFALYYHDLMDELGLDSAHIAGHSFGGMLAAEIAALCSHRVRRLVLVSADGLWRDDAQPADIFAETPSALAEKTYHDPESDAVRDAMKAPETKEAIMDAMYQRLQSLSAAGKFLWPIPDRGLKKRLHRIQAPALIVWGASDQVMPPVYAEDFRSGIKDSKVVVLEECGHVPMIEQPDAFVGAVGDFLSQA